MVLVWFRYKNGFERYVVVRKKATSVLLAVNKFSFDPEVEAFGYRSLR